MFACAPASSREVLSKCLDAMAIQRARQQATHTEASREVSRTRTTPRQTLLAAGYAGNQAALRRLLRPPPRLQCKLQIGTVNKPLEAEADRVVEQAVCMPDPVCLRLRRRFCGERVPPAKWTSEGMMHARLLGRYRETGPASRSSGIAVIRPAAERPQASFLRVTLRPRLRQVRPHGPACG
jgi:hypothetical protein